LPRGARVLEGRAAAAGDVSLLLYLELDADGETVARAVFRAHGCPSTVAAADWSCEWLRGRTLAEARGLTAGMIEGGAGLAPGKRDCGLLVEDALAATHVGGKEAV
jgi:nitrogen fixation NifU-like protein